MLHFPGWSGRWLEQLGSTGHSYCPGMPKPECLNQNGAPSTVLPNPRANLRMAALKDTWTGWLSGDRAHSCGKCCVARPRPVPFVPTISESWQLTSLITDESTEARGAYPTIPSGSNTLLLSTCYVSSTKLGAGDKSCAGEHPSSGMVHSLKEKRGHQTDHFKPTWWLEAARFGQGVHQQPGGQWHCWQVGLEKRIKLNGSS